MGWTEERLNNLVTVKMCNAEKRELIKHAELLDQLGHQTNWLGLQMGAFQGCMNLAMASFGLVVLINGGNRVISGELSEAALTTYLMLVQHAQKAFGN